MEDGKKKKEQFAMFTTILWLNFFSEYLRELYLMKEKCVFEISIIFRFVS